jgi:hypothetical protein
VDDDRGEEELTSQDGVSKGVVVLERMQGGPTVDAGQSDGD